VDRLTSRRENASRALAAFQKIASIPSPTDEQRDAAIKRFEYTFETTWKAAQAWLAEIQGREAGSPRACVIASRETGILTEDEAELALQMMKDRNLAAHTYNEDLAKALYAKLSAYSRLLEKWLGKTG